MKSDVIAREEFGHILAALTMPNRLAIEVSLCTGLRIGDVLNLRTESLAERMTVRESKTGKTRRVRLPAGLVSRLIGLAGRIWVFEGRIDYRKHRTRQAVYKDIKRAAGILRLSKKMQISPHSARKIYAVGQYQKTGDLEKVRKLLNHSRETVTMLYAMADVLTERRFIKK